MGIECKYISATKESPEVSVVVPFYNLEEYAQVAIESLVKQSFPDCEFVFVDDGSTDDTPAILDNASSHDSRIRVIHKQNEGVAAARNCGVEAACGKYVAFADGNDVVSPWYVESMLQVMDGQTDTMVFAPSKTVRLEERKSVKWRNPMSASYTETDRGGVASLILYKKQGTTSWGKLGPRELYLRCPFPVGVKREDVRSIANFVAGCKRFRIMTDEAIYGYVMRPDSCVWAESPTLEDAEDYLESIEASRDELAVFVPKDANCVLYYDALMKTRLHEYLNRVEGNSLEVASMEAKIRRDVRKGTARVLLDGNAHLPNRMRLLLYSISPKLLDVLYSAYRKKAKGF